MSAQHYADALEGFQWVWDHGLEVQPSIAGVRSSFMLGYWTRLANLYPPARAALAAARTTAEQKVRTTADSSAFLDVYALDQEAKDNARTLQLFEQVVMQHPDAARTLWPLIRDQAIVYKRVDLLQKYGSGLVDEFNRTKSIYLYSLGGAQGRLRRWLSSSASAS